MKKRLTSVNKSIILQFDMITLLENAQTRNKHTYNFVDDRGKVIGFNPYPDGHRIKYTIRNKDGHLIFDEKDEAIDFLLVGMLAHFDNDITFTPSMDDNTINAINFSLIRDGDPSITFSIHIEGKGGEYYCEDLGLSRKELEDLFSEKKLKEAKASVPKLAKMFQLNPTGKVFESPRLIDDKVFFDDRGYFLPIKPMFPIAQINISKSKKGVVRGMHWQKGDYAQKKVIHVLSGHIIDVVMDLRKGSPTYQQVFKFELGAGKKQSLYVPAGFAHGFQALEDDTRIMYVVDKDYSPENERSFNPESAVVCGDTFDYKIAIYSEKDGNSPYFFAVPEEDYPNG